MALFSFGKKKKDDEPATQTPQSGLPIDQVMTLKQQGYQDYQISEQLQSQGFNSSQIFEAMNQVNMNQQQNPQQQPQQSYPPEQGMMDQGQFPPNDAQPMMEQGFNPQQEQYPQMDMQQQNNGYEQEPIQQEEEKIDYSPPITEKERIEELAEAIIDEKWKDLISDINKVIEWKEKTETRIINLEQGIEHVKQALESLHKSLVAKISDYDKNINNVGIEIKAMEKVFQKILPTLTESVNRLDRLSNKTASSKK